MSQTQVEKEKRERKKEEEKKEEKVMRVKKPVLPLPSKEIVFQKVVHFKRVKAFLPIHAPRLELTELHLSKLVVKPSIKIVSKIIELPRFIMSKLFKIRIPISKFSVVNSSKLAPIIISLIPSIRMRISHIELHRVKPSKLLHEPMVKSSPEVFPSSKLLLNEIVKIQAQPRLSFKIPKVITETMQEIEIVPSKEREIIEKLETIPLGEAKELEDLFELLFDWEDPEKLEKLRSALTSPTATCIFLVPNNRTFHGELTIRKILANEFKRSYGEVDAKHDASSDLSDRSKNIVTISKNKVEKLAKILKKARKRSSYGR